MDLLDFRSQLVQHACYIDWHHLGLPLGVELSWHGLLDHAICRLAFDHAEDLFVGLDFSLVLNSGLVLTIVECLLDQATLLLFNQELLVGDLLLLMLMDFAQILVFKLLEHCVEQGRIREVQSIIVIVIRHLHQVKFQKSLECVVPVSRGHLGVIGVVLDVLLRLVVLRLIVGTFFA